MADGKEPLFGAPSPPLSGATGPLLEIRDLHKSFGHSAVLSGIDLSVKQGEVVVIIGASGSGKSTLLRCINRLEQPTGGTLLFNGATIGGSSLPLLRRRIGMVFQRFNLFPHLTAVQNVALGPRRVLGKSSEDAEQIAKDQLELVRLGEKISSYPHELSGGQQQRVAIARTLAMGPSLLLFDEPTSALDPELVGEVLEVMRSLVSDRRTMLIATHEMGFAREVADRVIFLDKGRILEEGLPGQVLQDPRQQRTREFLARVMGRP